MRQVNDEEMEKALRVGTDGRALSYRIAPPGLDAAAPARRKSLEGAKEKAAPRPFELPSWARTRTLLIQSQANMEFLRSRLVVELPVSGHDHCQMPSGMLIYAIWP